MVSRASESLPRPSTVVSSRSGRLRSVLTGPSCDAPYGAAGSAGDGDVDEPLGQLATVRGGAVGAKQPTREVHPVDDEVHLRGEVLARARREDRKSTRLNSSHANISYAVFCLKKKKN